MNIRKVGVVGCGQMGSGITPVCAQSGYETIVSELNDDLLKKGLAVITSRLARDVEKGRLAEPDRAAILARIHGTIRVEDFAGCDLIVEAATEDTDLKKQIFADLDRICPADTVLATNTSALSIMDIASATKRADKVLGLHFMNPAHVMKLVEVVRTIATSQETLKTGIAFSESLGKTPVVAPDTPGFLLNRMLTPFLLNAIRTLEVGVATKEDIDTAVRLGTNLPMGPLALIDFIGLDTIYAGAVAVYEESKNPQFAPPVLLGKMVKAGWWGRKTGKGFYEYNK
jgi:3-hydroxybutyryl-CoA dehydrogenase